MKFDEETVRIRDEWGSLFSTILVLSLHNVFKFYQLRSPYILKYVPFLKTYNTTVSTK